MVWPALVINALAVLNPVVAINVPMLPLVAFKLAELKFVTTPLVAPIAVKPLAEPPVICALPVLKFVAVDVVALNVVNPLTAPPVICALAVLKFVTTPVVLPKLIMLPLVVFKLTVVAVPNPAIGLCTFATKLM